MLDDNEISLEQLYKMLHVSKRKAVWMLQNGVIPCRVRNTSTHKYAIRIEDVEIYMERSKREKRDEIPQGRFSSRPVSSAIELPELYLTVRGEEQDRYIEHLKCMLTDAPDRLSVKDVAAVTGYSADYINDLIDSGELYAVKLYGAYCIPKVQLIAFLATDKAFGIRRKSEWHKSVIQNFIHTQGDLYPMKDCQKKLYHEIGERIRKSRQEARISQEELAEYAGISGSYISDIEAGKRNFSVDVLMKIAEALQVSTDWILRANTSGTAAVLNRDIERILDGLSADELNDVMLILTDIKRSIKRAKCIAKRYGDN